MSVIRNGTGNVHGNGRRRRGLTLVELGLAAAVLAVALNAAVCLLARCGRELARSEDQVRFQGLASHAADALARSEFGKVSRTAPRGPEGSDVWAAAQASLIAAPAGVRLTSWVRDLSADALLLTVTVEWMDADARGRAIRQVTTVRRLLTRPDVSLEAPVAMPRLEPKGVSA